MKTLILGMGNDLLADDGVGPKVAEELKKRNKDPNVEVMETALAGLQLLDIFIGFDRAIIVDAIQTKGGKPGDAHLLTLDDLGGGVPTSLHHFDLPTILAAGKALGAAMPQDVRIFAVEATDVTTFGGACCPEVEAAIPRVVDLILAELRSTDEFAVTG